MGYLSFLRLIECIINNNVNLSKNRYIDIVGNIYNLDPSSSVNMHLLKIN